MVFDPSNPVIDESKYQKRDWISTEFVNLQDKQELPHNMPQPKETSFTVRVKVDTDHVDDIVTRRSRITFLVYVNSALAYWVLKKKIIENLSFGSELTAMKQYCEYIRGLVYKLQMMGISCAGLAYIEADNQSVISNTIIPDSTLKKKSQIIAYHMVREGVARDEWRTAYVITYNNQADLLTNQLHAGENRRGEDSLWTSSMISTEPKMGGLSMLLNHQIKWM